MRRSSSSSSLVTISPGSNSPIHPKKQGSKAVKGVVDDSDEIAWALLQRSSRKELETWILKTQSSQSIINAFGSEEKQTVIDIKRGKRTVAIRTVPLRCGASTGFFNMINDECLEEVFSYLCTYDRVRTTLFVCKGWYELRKNARLWKDIDIIGGPSRYHKEAVPMNSKSLRTFSTIFDLSQLHTLKLTSGSKTDNNAWKHFIRALPRAPSILSCDGDISKQKSNMSMIAQHFGAKLESLTITEGKFDEDHLMDTLKYMPRLTELTLCSYGVNNSQFFLGILRALQNARSGGSTLLTKLRLSDKYCFSVHGGLSPLDLFKTVGQSYPDLEQFSWSLSFAFDSMQYPPLAEVVELRRLHTLNLRLNQLARVMNRFNTTLEEQAQVYSHSEQKLLKLFGYMNHAFPQLKNLNLTSQTQYLSTKDARSGKIAPPCVSVHPSTFETVLQIPLETLRLKNFSFSAALTQRMNLSRMKHLSLGGPGAQEAVDAVKIRKPVLKAIAQDNVRTYY